MAELLWQAAQPPSLALVWLVAACSHGPAAGAVSSFKLEARWGSRIRGRRQRPGQVRPARSKPSCILCTLPGHPCAPVLVPRSAPARPSRTLPGSFREYSWVPDVIVVLCADSQGHQPTMQAMKPSLSSLRVVSVAEQVDVSGRLPWPQRWLPQCFPEVSGRNYACARACQYSGNCRQSQGRALLV